MTLSLPKRLAAIAVLLSIPLLCPAQPLSTASPDESITVVLRVAVIDTPSASIILATTVTAPISRIETGLDFHAPALEAAELVYADAIGIEKALGYIPRAQVVLSEALHVKLGSREVSLVSFQRDPEAPTDEWFLKVAVRPLSLMNEPTLALAVEAEAVRFPESRTSVAGADLLRLALGRTLLAILDLPSAEDEGPARTVLILVRLEPPSSGELSDSERKKRDLETRVLAGRIDLDIQDLPLFKALLKVREAAGEKLGIVIDPALPPKTHSFRVSLSASQIPLGEALDRILSGLNLAYELDAGLVFVTSPNKVGDVLVRTYPHVMQLMFQAFNVDTEWEERLLVPAETSTGQETELYRFTPDLLIEYILQHVSPQSWWQNGGKGTISYSDALGALIICQTPDNHSRVAQLLDRLTYSHESGTPPTPAPQTQNSAD